MLLQCKICTQLLALYKLCCRYFSTPRWQSWRHNAHASMKRLARWVAALLSTTQQWRPLPPCRWASILCLPLLYCTRLTVHGKFFKKWKTRWNCWLAMQTWLILYLTKKFWKLSSHQQYRQACFWDTQDVPSITLSQCPISIVLAQIMFHMHGSRQPHFLKPGACHQTLWNSSALWTSQH